MHRAIPLCVDLHMTRWLHTRSQLSFDALPRPCSAHTISLCSPGVVDEMNKKITCESSTFFPRAVLVLSHSRARTTCSRNEHIYIPQCLGSIIVRCGCSSSSSAVAARRSMALNEQEKKANEIFRRTQNLILHSCTTIRK